MYCILTLYIYTELQYALIKFISIILVCTKSGGHVVHSYGRLIPHEFPITDLQQISGPDGIGRITCTVSSGTAGFYRSGGVLESDAVTQTRHGATATLEVNLTDKFHNRQGYCKDSTTNYFYIFISATGELLHLFMPHFRVTSMTSTS